MVFRFFQKNKKTFIWKTIRFAARLQPKTFTSAFVFVPLPRQERGGSKQLNSDYLGSEGTEVEDEQKTTVTVAHKVESKSSFWSDSKD